MNSTTTLSMLTLAAGFACVPLAVCGFAAAWLCGVGACMMLLPFRGRSSLWRRRSTSDNDLLFGGGFLEDKGARLVPKIFWESYCSTFQSKIRRTKCDLIIKLITWMDGKSRDESIKSN